MKYAIKANFKEYHRGDVLGMSQYTLTKNNKWYLATNDALVFNTLKEAREYVKNNKIVESRPQLGSDTCPYIVNSRGRVYSVFN